MERGWTLWITLNFLATLLWTLRRVQSSVLIVQDHESGWTHLDVIDTGLEKDTQIFKGTTGDTENHMFGILAPSYKQNSFHRFYIENDYILIGSRNVLFNVSLINLKENRVVSWPPASYDIELCLQRQKSGTECQNYIRVIERKNENEILVCGTNAFRPLCRTYKESKNGPVLKDEESGTARCPYDPQHNSTAVLHDGRLYAATVADLSSRDSLIYSGPLRTEQHDSQWLNEPDFVNSFGHRDRVYFFFRETAVENINCGKAVFSRVARVCTNDSGGARVLRNTWTTFSKARLNCSLPGDFPFYFDELQSTTGLGIGNVFPTLVRKDGVEMVYAVFSTPRNSLRGSAVCAFKMSDIVQSFEGPYKEQRTALSNWLPVREQEVPQPHPGLSCPNDSSSLSDQTLNFIKSHPLMDRAVPAFGGQPIMVQASFNFSFTQIAVDWQVYAADRRYYDILFIGTDDGKVYKAINKGWGKHVETVVIEVLQVFEDGSPVSQLTVYRDERYHQAKLIVASANEVRSIPLARCHHKPTCSECMALRDPYCSWKDNKCADSFYGIQSIDTGRHLNCPAEKPVRRTMLQTSTAQTTVVTCPPCLTKEIPTKDDHQKEDTIDKDEDREFTTTVKWIKNKNNRQTEKSLKSFSDDESDNIKTKTDHSPDDSTPHSAAAAAATDQKRYGPDFFIPILISCIIVSLIAGFAAGYCVALRFNTPHHSATYRVMNRDCEVTINAPTGHPGLLSPSLTGSGSTGAVKSVENLYEPEPLGPIKWPYLGSVLGEKKQCNVSVNELKPRTSDRPNNYETSLLRNNIHKGAVDL